MMKRTTWLLLIAFLANHIMWALPPAEAANSNETLHFGRLQFYAGNYAESLDKLNKAIDDGNLSLEELATAYYLKARCEARRDKKKNAVKAFCKMYETEYPIVIAKSDFTAMEMKVFREAGEKCAPKTVPVPAPPPAPVQKQVTTAPAKTHASVSQAAQPSPDVEVTAKVPTQSDAAPKTAQPVEAATAQNAPVESAPVEIAPVVAQKSGAKRWYQKPFSWVFGAGLAGLVYLLATNDSDRVLADPDAR